MVATIPSHLSKSTRPRPSRPPTKQSKTPALSVVSPKAKSTINSLPSQSSTPLSVKLQCLLTLQRGSSIFTASVVALTLGIYAWTVYVPKLWSKEFRKLETLQSYERQLVAMDETLKNQLLALVKNSKNHRLKKEQEFVHALLRLNPYDNLRQALPTNKFLIPMHHLF